MNDPQSERGSLPLWYLDTFRLVQQVDGGLRNVELTVREGLATAALDRRVRHELEGLLESLHTLQGSLVLVDMTARAVLEEADERAVSLG